MKTIKILKGSKFLKINDNASDVDYFIFDSEKKYNALVNFIVGSGDRSNTWHLYEVLSQTNTLVEGTFEQLDQLKQIVFNYLSIADFFIINYYCTKYFTDRVGDVWENKTKRAVHFMQIFEMYEVYKNTGEFTFTYDKMKMKALRRIKYSQWSQVDKNRFEYLLNLMQTDFDIDFTAYFTQRNMQRSEIEAAVTLLAV